MFKIKNCSIKNELTYRGSVILKYDIEYPQIFSVCYNTDTFNSINLRKALELENYAKDILFKDAMDLYNYNFSNGYPIMIYELVYKYTITYNKEPIISLYADEYVYSGGPHGSTIRTSQNWNIECNKQFYLSELYDNNPNYILYILKEINKQIEEKGKEFFFGDYCSLVLQTLNLDQFYITPNCAIIYFQQYDIAPYSTGIPEFCLLFNV